MEQCSILIYPYPEDGKGPSSGIHMETTMSQEAFCAENGELMRAFHQYCECREPDSREPGERCTFRVWDGAHSDLVSCAEEEIIALQLKYWKDTAVTVKEVRYQGHIYTGIDISEELDSVRLCEDRKDHPAAVYFLLDGPTPFEGGEIGGGRLSVLKANENLMYAGEYSFESKPYTVPNKDWDAEQGIWVDHEELYEEVFKPKLFLETDGEDLTFSVLFHGGLCPKISRDDARVVFYNTPDDASDPCERKDTSRDFSFESIYGKYQYFAAAGTSDAAKGKFDGVIFTPPEVPAPLDRESAQRLYREYLHALYTAFAGAEEYRADGYTFKRADTGSMLCAKTDDFTLYGEFFVPSLNSIYTRDHFRYFNIWDYGFTSSEHLVITRAVFSRGGAEVAFCPKPGKIPVSKGHPFSGFDTSDFIIEVNDGEQHGGSFDELNKRGFFSQEQLPETVRFDWHFSAFAQHIEVYKKIKRAILNVPLRQFVRDLTGILQELSSKDMEKLLYGEDLVPDPDVISLAMELQAKYTDTGKIPNIALIGEAGTGKSTMASKIAHVLFGKGIMENSPADLKAPYTGQTKYETLTRLIEAAKNDQIFFIDEAYTLMHDKFGAEAVSLLLPLMTDSPNVRTLTARLERTTISVNFTTGKMSTQNDGADPIVEQIPTGFPSVWIAGYEDDIRLMLSENQGLYRRFRRLRLKTPTTSELYEELLGKTRKLIKPDRDGSAAEDKARILLNLFEKKADLIKKFFQWGAQPQNSKYFASHAGAENFLERCLYGIDFSSGQSEEDIIDQMETIINQIKRDIKRQLDTLRRKGGRSGVEDGDRVEMVTDNKTRFDHLIGCDEQIKEMKKFIEMLLHKSVYDERAMTVPKGALLLGRPGVGKTFIARAMAGELQARCETEAPDKHVGFMSLSAPEMTAKEPSFIRSVFDKAEEYDACVIFIDEVDAIAKRRSQNGYYSHFIELIKQMDGIERRSNVFVLAATNAPESLDPAFTRAGRIDKELTFDLPNRAARMELAKKSLDKRCRKLPMFDVEESKDGVQELAEKLAAMTPGYTPGDIENIVNTAFILYYQDEEEQSSPKVLSAKEWMDCLYGYLYEAVERKRIGGLRPKGEETFSADQNNESRSSTAVHEVGHALVEVLRGHEPFEKITALPRGSALGYVTPKQNPVLTKADFENRIRSAMGGRIAEEIVYGEDNISVGASSDIRYATSLARYMVEEIGFDSEFRFMTLKESTARYLGEDQYICSEAFRKQSDEVVNELLKGLYLETKYMLADKRELIIALAKEVFERETMTGQEFLQLYREKLKD